MQSFVIGRVLEPERRQTQKGKNFVEFGLVSGKTSQVCAVWDTDSCYGLACKLREGARVVVIVNPTVDERGRLKTYVNNLAFAPDGLRESLMSLFAPEPPQEAAPLPEPPMKKVGA